MRAFNNFVREWASTFVGFAVLAVLMTWSASTVAVAYGLFGAPSGINESDLAIIEKVEEKKDPKNKVVIREIVPTTPKRLIFPSIDFAIDVQDSTVSSDGEDWPLSNVDAHYANFTPGLGSLKGTMLMYGHNRWSVLRNTADLKTGDKMIVIDENNKKWEFVLRFEKIITPEQTEFIYEDVPFRIVVFTCDGWDSAERRLMFFDPA